MVNLMIHACCERCFCSLHHHHLSDDPAGPTVPHVQLAWCRGKVPCVLPLRTLAPWPRTSLPQVMSPTTTSLQRLMSNTPRSPRTSSGSLMTFTTMRSPSVRRSLMRAEDEPITLKTKACRPVCRRQSVMAEPWDPLFSDLCRAPKKLRITGQKMSKSGFFWSDKESRFSLTVKRRFENTNSRQKKYSKVEWNDRVTKRRYLSCSSRRRTTSTRSTTSPWIVFEAILGSSWSSWEKASMSWRNSCDFRVQLARYRNCMMKSIVWMMREISRCWISTQWTFTRYQSTCVFRTTSRSLWNKPFFWNAEPQKWTAKHLGHAWKIRKRFCKIQLRLLQHLFRRNLIHGVLIYQNKFIHHRRRRMETKHQFRIRIRDASLDRQPQVVSSLVREDSWNNYGAHQQRLQISDLHFDKFPSSATFACWKIRFKTEVCTCSQFPTEAMHWIKEVEVVE